MRGIIPLYLASQFILPFMVSAFFFASFLLTFQLFRITRYIISKGVGPETVIELVMHIMITFLPIAIPLSALFASIYVMGKLSDDSEIVAMRSFGFSRNKMLMPFLILGLFLGISVFSLNQSIIPESGRKFKNGILRLTSSGLLSDIKKGNFFLDIPGVTLFAEDKSEDGVNLKNLFIHYNEKNGEKVIYAKQGILIKENSDAWGVRGIRLLLKSGNMSRFSKDSDKIEKSLFETYEFPVWDGSGLIFEVNKHELKSSKDLWAYLKSTPIEKRADKTYIKAEIEYWARYSAALQSLLFVVIGAMIGVKQGRGRGKSPAGQALLLACIYYTLYFTGLGFAKKAMIPASVAVFAPFILMVLYSIRSYKKMNWV